MSTTAVEEVENANRELRRAVRSLEQETIEYRLLARVSFYNGDYRARLLMRRVSDDPFECETVVAVGEASESHYQALYSAERAFAKHTSSDAGGERG